MCDSLGSKSRILQGILTSSPGSSALAISSGLHWEMDADGCGLEVMGGSPQMLLAFLAPSEGCQGAGTQCGSCAAL